MTYRVVVWGTGNVGRPAIRAVAAHGDLELVGVVVSNPAKVGKDAGELAGIEPLGVAATDDVSVAFADDVDAVVYTATADTRPDEAFVDLIACLEAGRQRGVDLVLPAAAPGERATADDRRGRARVRDGRLVGLRVGHRPGLGARHPAGAA